MIYPLTIRATDCDMYGHANNAAYIAFFSDAVARQLRDIGLADDFSRTGSHRWHPAEFRAEYRQALSAFDTASVETGRVALSGDRLSIGCHIQTSEGKTSFRASASWQRELRATGRATPLDELLLTASLEAFDPRMRPFQIPEDNPNARRYINHFDISAPDIAPTGVVHPHVAFRWFEEGMIRGALEAGWPKARMEEAEFVTYQIRHNVNIDRLPRPDESVSVVSRLISVKRLYGTWLHELFAGDEAVARDFSTGVFLNLDGRPSSPPWEMMNDIVGYEVAPR